MAKAGEAVQDQPAAVGPPPAGRRGDELPARHRAGTLLAGPRGDQETARPGAAAPTAGGGEGTARHRPNPPGDQPARHPAGQRHRTRRPGLSRGSLTRERIVAESLRLLDEHGVAGFSMPKLGRALGADPTAVYRHFASKDELVLAIGDRLFEEEGQVWAQTDCWVETLIDATRRLRRVYLDHPAAASLVAHRTTQGPAEMRIVDVIIGAVLAAGFEGAEAAVVYRTIGDFALSWCGGEAAFRAMDERQQEADRAAWTRTYLAADRDRYPHIWQIREELPRVDDDAIFESVLGIVIVGLCQQAPRPCACGRHP